MKNYNSNFLRKILQMAFLITVLVFSLGATTNTGDKNKVNSLSKVQDKSEFFVFNINNLYMPLDNKGIIAAVDPGDGIGPGGMFDGNVFLFSAGFYVSGYFRNDAGEKELFGNGVLSASRIEDYQQGPVGSQKTDPKNMIYTVAQQDKPFTSDSWQDWKDAVSLGADFYDGDGDGIYNPVDLNGNGKWDPEEDRPDLLGDVTAWCVYNDGVPSALRKFSVNPLGIEIQQTVFGFQAKSIVGNLMFVRYRIKNTGTVEDTLSEVYFAAAADPDLGDYADDLVGSDIDISAGYVYNATPDAQFGEDCPAFLMDFFQGPKVYIEGETFTDVDGDGIYTDGVDTPLDTAYAVKGLQIGIDKFPGAKNLPMTSMTQYIQSDPTHGDPDTHHELRQYMLGGHGKAGDSVYVSTWKFGNGEELGADTLMPAHFMYSGEPEPHTGWLNDEGMDQRQMSNTGPFNLIKGETQDIYVAYVVGRGTTSLNSVTVAKEIDKTAQKIFDNNFPAPPPPPSIDYTITSGDGFIDVSWDTYEQLPYDVQDTVMIIRNKFEGYYLSAYRTNSSQISIQGVENYKELVSYDLDNIVETIWAYDPTSPDKNIIKIREVSDNTLDSLLYADPATGRLRYRITKDPFTGESLIPGKEYYFAIGQYALNHWAIVNKQDSVYGKKGDYLASSPADYREYEEALATFMYQVDESDPAIDTDFGTNPDGSADGEVKYVVVDKEQLTGDEYKVEFMLDPASEKYNTMWKLTNTKTSKVLVDSSKNYNFDNNITAGIVTEGFLAKVKEVVPEMQLLNIQQKSFETDSVWYGDFTRQVSTTTGSGGTGIYYVGMDLNEVDDALNNPIGNPLFEAKFKSTVITADRLRDVKIVFGEPSKAYRYLSGFRGRVTQDHKFFPYAEAITSADTVSKGPIGKWDDANDHAIGLVDVPFSVYTADKKYGDVGRQLAVAFIETASDSRISAKKNPWGSPDGEWNPLNKVSKSKEVIVIFDTEYSEAGGDPVYTGKYVDAAGNDVWADIVNGYTIPTGKSSVEDSILAASPFFNAMYVVNLERKYTDSVTVIDSTITPPDTSLIPTPDDQKPFYTNGDSLVIRMETHPYTAGDVYTFTTKNGGELTEDEMQKNFDKVNVFPNPLFAYNPQTSYDTNLNPDDPFVTFNHIPEDATITIYSLSGSLLQTLTATSTSQFVQWDLKNKDRLRVASGLYIALVDSPKFGQKILKFSVILPQKQLQRF